MQKKFRAKRGTPVLLTWQTIAGGTIDPTSGSTIGTATAHTLTVNAVLHFTPAASVARQFVEIQEGDCIAEFDPDVVLDGLIGLTFTIDGQVWAQAKVGEELSKMWDVIESGVRVSRCVVLRKST